MKRFQSPASRALARMSTRISGYGVPGRTSSSSARSASNSTGRTCSSMNARTRSRRSETRGLSSKSTRAAYPSGAPPGAELAGRFGSRGERFGLVLPHALAVEPDLEGEQGDDHERRGAHRRDEDGRGHLLLDEERDRRGDHHHSKSVAQEAGWDLHRELAADQHPRDRAD